MKKYDFFYNFPTLQEVPVIGWEDVIHKITSNKQSKQKIAQSNTLYENWMKEQGFQDTMLSLKRNIIDVALKSRIDIEQSKWETRTSEKETVVFCDHGYKYGEQSISSDMLSVTDLQNKAGKAAEKVVSELVHIHYPFVHPGAQVFANTNDPVCKTIRTIKLKSTQVPETEVFGPNSHPDLYFNFECETFFGEILDLHILVEVKSVLSTVKPDNTLEAKYNNATNCKNLVIKDLDIFKDKVVFLNLNGQTGENANKTKIYTTLTAILYYFPDTKNNNLTFFDYDLTFMPLTLEFDISPKTGKITEKVFTVKSNGENSVNNNVNLSLSTPQGIYEEQDILFNRLMLYLYGQVEGRNHLLTKQEVLLSEMKKHSENLTNMFNKWPDINIDTFNKFYINFNKSYKFIQKHVDQEFREIDNEDNKSIVQVYESAKANAVIFKKIKNHINESLNMEKRIKGFLDIQDSMTYLEFKQECNHIRSRWYVLKNLEDKFFPTKDKIQELVDSLKKELLLKKRNSI